MYDTRLAYPAGPVRRGLAGPGGATPPQPGLGGQDLVHGAATTLSGPLPRRATPHLAAARPPLARPGGPGQGGVLRPGPLSRPARCQRLHVLHRPARDDPGHALRAPDLPLRADLLELGDRHGLCRGEPREPQRGVAERPVGTRRRAAGASHRPADRGHPAGRAGAGGVQAVLPGAAAALRPGGASHPGGQGQRERRCRAEPPPVQAGPGTGVVAARPPGLRQPRGLRGVPAPALRAAQCRAAAASGGGTAPVAAAAGGAFGVVQAAAGARGQRQHDPRRGEHLLGVEPSHRRAGRGAVVRRAGRGLVRPASCRGAAAAAGAGQAPDRVSAHDRLAGAQAGGVRGLPLSGGPVPVEPLPHGL